MLKILYIYAIVHTLRMIFHMLKKKDIPHEKMKVLLASSNKFVAGEILLPTSTQYIYLLVIIHYEPSDHKSFIRERSLCDVLD